MEQSKKRQAQLFGLGMAKRGYGFSFKEYFVSAYSIEYMTPADWDKYIDSITNHIYKMKSEQTYSDVDKAKEFIQWLKKVEAPYQFEEGRLKELIDGTIYSIQEVANYLEEEVEACAH